MSNPYRRATVTTDFADELLALNETVESQKVVIDDLTLKAAYYKAGFFHRYDLAEKLMHQIEENCNYCVSDSNGFDGCFITSWYARAVYRTLADMYTQGLIAKEEYEFCNI